MAYLQNSIIGSQRVGIGNHMTNLGFGCCTFQSTSGAYSNTAFGVCALQALTSGDSNTALGYKALAGVTTGYGNTAVGNYAGAGVTTGEYNTFIGYRAGTGMTGTNNTVLGFCSGVSHGGNGNTIIGYFAAKHGTAHTGHCATAIGTSAGCTCLSTKSVVIGKSAQGYNAYNTIVGNYSYGGSYSTVIGNNAYGGTAVKAVILGHYASAGNCGIAVGFQASSGATDHTVWGSSSHNVKNCIWPTWTNLSDQRDKANIQSLNSKYGIDFIKRLKPKTFCWDNRETYVRECGFEFGTKDGTFIDNDENYGFIAQEVKETIDELGIKFDALGGEENDAYRLQYGAFIAPMIKTVQEIAERLDLLDIEVTQLETA